jgi:hypothetical protein
VIDPNRTSLPPPVFGDSGDLLPLDTGLACMAASGKESATSVAFTEAANWVREISQSYNCAHAAVSDIAKGEGAAAAHLIKKAKDALAGDY